MGTEICLWQRGTLIVAVNEQFAKEHMWS